MANIPVSQTAATRQNNGKSTSDAKPHIPHRRTIIILLTVSAALIWFNADALLFWPAFQVTWVGLFPWIDELGSLSFILGVILGLVIDMGAIAYSFGARAEAAFMVFPAAMISLLIGGGFLAGLIIAVLTGIFIMMNERVLQEAESQSTTSAMNIRQGRSAFWSRST